MGGGHHVDGATIPPSRRSCLKTRGILRLLPRSASFNPPYVPSSGARALALLNGGLCISYLLTDTHCRDSDTAIGSPGEGNTRATGEDLILIGRTIFLSEFVTPGHRFVSTLLSELSGRSWPCAPKPLLLKPFMQQCLSSRNFKTV